MFNKRSSGVQCSLQKGTTILKQRASCGKNLTLKKPNQYMWRQIGTVWSMNYLLCTNRWVVNNFSLYWREISATFTDTAVNNYLVYTKEKLANVSRWTEQWWEIKLLTWTVIRPDCNLFSRRRDWEKLSRPVRRKIETELSMNPVTQTKLSRSENKLQHLNFVIWCCW